MDFATLFGKLHEHEIKLERLVNDEEEEKSSSQGRGRQIL